jgi:hypothetical protein
MLWIPNSIVDHYYYYYYYYYYHHHHHHHHHHHFILFYERMYHLISLQILPRAYVKFVWHRPPPKYRTVAVINSILYRICKHVYALPWYKISRVWRHLCNSYKNQTESKVQISCSHTFVLCSIKPLPQQLCITFLALLSWVVSGPFIKCHSHFTSSSVHHVVITERRKLIRVRHTTHTKFCENLSFVSVLKIWHTSYGM